MTNPDLTHIEFLLDRSGSMESIKSDIEGGFDAYIADQKARPGQCTVSLAQFDDRYESVFTGVPIAEVPPLALTPRGMTALLDGIGRTVNELGARLAGLPENERPGTVIFAIMTDGLENASREFTHGVVKAMITHQEQVYNWQFLYMGADQDAIEVGSSLGIASEHTMTWSRGRVKQAYAAMSRMSGDLRAAPAGSSLSDIGFSEAERESAAS